MDDNTVPFKDVPMLYPPQVPTILWQESFRKDALNFHPHFHFCFWIQENADIQVFYLNTYRATVQDIPVFFSYSLRLRLVDQDGSVKFSPVVRVTGNCGGAVTVYPNPAKNRIYIQGAEKLKQIQLLDVQGRLIKNLQSSGNNNFNIQFLRPGTYWVKMIGDEVQTFKLIKE